MSKPKLPPKDFVWSPNLAYAVGLLATDGNLSSDGRHLVMRSMEKELLETFKLCLNLENKIGIADKGYRVQFGDVQLYNWLLKIGLFPAKTYTLGRINVPDQYFRDFLRGHLDGDGSVVTYIDSYGSYRGRKYTNQRIFTHFISASPDHIKWLQQQINRLAAVAGALIKNKPLIEGRVPIWQLKFAKKESLRLLDWIYYHPDLPCLQRKRKNAFDTITIIMNTKRRTYSFINS